jgi:outer membrane protein assembly factor BamB
LQPNTRYYVRAYASNTVGLSYGNEQNFTTTTAPVDSAVSLYIGGKDSLFAFNAQTGALKWKRYIGPEYIYSSPAYSNGKIFLPYRNKLFAFDTLGNALWTATTNNANVNGLQSPIVSNGLVYTCNEGSSFIYAFNEATGNLAWSFDAWDPSYTNFGSADLAIAGNTIYIGGQYTYAINALTGALRWKSLTGSMVLPLISNGKVYVMSDHTLFTLDSATGTVVRSKKYDVFFTRPMSLNLATGRFFYRDEHWTAAI